MTTMDQYHYVKDQNGSTLWIKTPPTPRLAVSRFRHWLFPAVTAVILLTVIIILGASSKYACVFLLMPYVGTTAFGSLVRPNISNDLHQLKLAVGKNKDQLTSVTKTLKKLSVIDSLSKSVAAIKCTIKLILNNNAGDCCPVGWTGFESSCYFFSSESQSWNESRDWCETQQAHLIILHTDKQWDFVINQTIPQYFWVGLSDWRTGSWEWVDQTLYTVERWKPGQPDNWAHHGHGPGNEDCAHLHNDGRLNDQHCSIKEPIVSPDQSLHPVITVNLS
uniref:C-type lectin domain-containing protein n=1 Tax=Pundamilia nyererei TaxID=303518 RepID=A0A3B4EX45_9CICH